MKRIDNLLKHSQDICKNHDWTVDDASVDCVEYEAGYQKAIADVKQLISDTKASGEKLYEFHQEVENLYMLHIYANDGFDDKTVREIVFLARECYMKESGSTSIYAIADGLFEALKNGYSVEQLTESCYGALDIAHRFIND